MGLEWEEEEEKEEWGLRSAAAGWEKLCEKQNEYMRLILNIVKYETDKLKPKPCKVHMCMKYIHRM